MTIGSTIGSILARLLPAWRRLQGFLAGFVREHASESSVRLLMIMFGATACIEAHRIVSFAFDHATEHLTVGELTGVVVALLGTGCCGMALRTRSADSAEAELQKLKCAADAKLATVADSVSGAP